jgi:hypothetical protein
MGAASLANPQSLNFYSYVRNNPVNSVDPSGLLPGLTCMIDGVPVNCSTAFNFVNHGFGRVAGGAGVYGDGSIVVLDQYGEGEDGPRWDGHWVFFDPSMFDSGGQGDEWGKAGNPKNNAKNFFRNFDCGKVINDVAKATGKSTWQDALDKATFISLTNDHPDWNKQLVGLGYSADMLKEQGYPTDMTLGAYFSQPGKNVIGLTIPSKNTTYLGESYRNMTGQAALKTPAHETIHQIFGTHLDIAKAFQDHAGFLPGENLSNIPDGTLSQLIDAWVFDRRCGKD